MSDETIHPALDLIRRRRTAEEFDTVRPVGDETIRQLVSDATRAPSSFNIQHWRFLAVCDEEAKERLCRVAYGQEQVRSAGVTFVVLGDVRGAERLPQIMQRAVDDGLLPEAKASAWQRMAEEIYSDPTVAREEAVRSASLAAMTLMLAAEAQGLVSGALTGFDPEALVSEFAIPARHVPVMLVAVGHPARDHGTGPRMSRLDVDDVLALDRWPETDGDRS